MIIAKIKYILSCVKSILHHRPLRVEVPYDVADIEKGTVMTVDELFERISDYETTLENEHEEITSLVDNLRAEIDGLHSDIEEFYRPIDPYEYNGVKRSDFF